MSPAPAIGSRRSELQRLTNEAARMIVSPDLFHPCEVLAQLLAATRIAFDITGIGDEGTKRRALHTAIVDYIDLPAAVAGQGLAA